MNTLQKATDKKYKELANAVIANMEVFEMTKAEAIEYQKEQSCFTNKSWKQIEQVVNSLL